MKNLSQRNKVILALAAILIVVLAGVIVLQNPPANELLGATALVITPSNPTIVVGNSIGLSVNATYNCAWSSSDTSKVSLVNYTGETKSVTVQGLAAGSATITAKCGIINVNKVTTTVTVNPPLAITPSSTSIIVGNTKQLSVPSVYTCNWTSSSAAVSFVGATSGSTVTVQGNTVGQSSTVTAQCGVPGSSSAQVNVTNLAFSPSSTAIGVGSKINRSAPEGAISPCTWTTSNGGSLPFQVNGQLTSSPQTGTSVTLYGSNPGQSTIGISCSSNQSANQIVTVCAAGDNNCIGGVRQ